MDNKNQGPLGLAWVVPWIVFSAVISPGTLSAAPARWVQTAPPAVLNATTLYDSRRHREIVIANGLWAVSGGPRPSWTYLGGPPPANACFYDPVLDWIWAFEPGCCLSPGPGALFSMDLGVPNPVWTPQAFTGFTPAKRIGFSYVFDPLAHRLIFFGGYVTGGDATNTLAVLTLSGTPAWTYPTANGVSPTPRGYSVACYDSVRDRMLFYGGQSGQNPIPGITYYDETWSLSLRGTLSWSFLPPRNSVALARSQAPAALDSFNHRLIVFGGSGPGGGPDLWALDLSPGAPPDSAIWTKLPPGPPPRGGQAVWIDATRRRLLQVGGGGTAAGLFDAWAMDLDQGTWENLVPDSLSFLPQYGLPGYPALMDDTRHQWLLWPPSSGATWAHDVVADLPWRPTADVNPPGVRSTVGARDDFRGDNYLLGGTDLWALHDGAATWTHLVPPSFPPDRTDGALMLCDPTRRRLLVHGGWYTPFGKIRTRDDTWLYAVIGDAWSALNAGSYGGRWAETGIYDPVRDRFVAFGGVDTLAGFSDVHTLSFTAGGGWKALATTGTPPPATLTQSYHAAYDAAGDRMLVLGQGDTGLALYALTLDSNPTWSVVPVNGVLPPSRPNFASAFSSSHRQWLISGGGTTNNERVDSWVLFLDGESSMNALPITEAMLPDHVSVGWQEIGLPVGSFTLYRRVSNGPWQPVTTLSPNADRRLLYDDFEAQFGNSYDYRLGAIVDGSEQFFGSVTVSPVTSAPPPAMRIQGVWPNPTRAAVDLVFSLPKTASVRVELIDLAGRRVADRALGLLGPGGHACRLAERGTLAPGLYFARVTTAGHSEATKVVVAR